MRALCSARILFIVAAALVLAAGAQAQQPGRVHDPAIIRSGDWYYVYCTGAGVPIQRSRDLITWTRIGKVMEHLPEWALADVPGSNWPWAPDISFRNGNYYLYYSVSTFGRNLSCIGLMTNTTLDPDSPDYKWVDQGKIVQSTPGKDNFNAIDPNLVVDEKGQPWLSFGSFWSGIKMIRIDAETGKRPAGDTEIIDLARRPSPGAIEAPCIVRKNDWFYLFASFDYCCKGVNSTYNIRVARSKSVRGPYVDRDGKPMLEGGGTLVLDTRGSVRGPGHNAVLLEAKGDRLVHHYYDADARGMAKLQVRPLNWDEAGWPIAGEALK